MLLFLENSGFFLLYGLYCRIIDFYDDYYVIVSFFVVLIRGLQVIDLTRVSQEIASHASDVDLVILEGMV
jgi:hypothetical protein